MTVAELIKHLETFPPDTLVVQRDELYGYSRWKSMDGWWPQMVTVVPAESGLFAGYYFNPSHNAEDTIDALEI